MKTMFKYVLAILALSLMVVSCSKDDDGFDEPLLYGKWQLITENGKDVAATGEYWKYFSDGKGYTWVESDDEWEEDALDFTWTLNKTELKQIHIMEVGGSVPKTYTVTELSSTTLKYQDSGAKRVFKKISD